MQKHLNSIFLEALGGFEPPNQSFADSCLTTWLQRRIIFNFWSGRRGSNPRPMPWQGIALSTELLPQKIKHNYNNKFYIKSQ